jgi:hypothetical protein
MGRGIACAALTGVFFLALPVSFGGARGKQDGPKVPAAIQVPRGHKLLFEAEAKGVQIYKSAPGTGGKLEWVLEAPLADLFGPRGKKLGWHYEGPSWEDADGSKVTRNKGQAVKTAAAPNPREDVPWLLIKVKPETGSKGSLSRVRYVQRVHTKGGKAPAAAPRRAGTKVGVPYSATYRFYGPEK